MKHFAIGAALLLFAIGTVHAEEPRAIGPRDLIELCKGELAQQSESIDAFELQRCVNDKDAARRTMREPGLRYGPEGTRQFRFGASTRF